MEKLVVVLREPAQALVEALGPHDATVARYEVDVTQSYPESERYPSRPGVTGVVMISADSVGDELALATIDACGGEQSVVGAWRLTEAIQWDYEQSWSGTATPGMKQISFLTRAARLTRAQFAAHWQEIHAPLASKHHPTIWRYVQNVFVERLTVDAPEIDGVAELSYRSYEDWRDRKFDSPEGQAIITADIPRFLDTTSAWHVLAHEHVLPSA
jgi:uncharacterized protein (TIGR02118 family)